MLENMRRKRPLQLFRSTEFGTCRLKGFICHIEGSGYASLLIPSWDTHLNFSNFPARSLQKSCSGTQANQSWPQDVEQVKEVLG